MHIYLEHPRHGQKVAISEQEAIHDERSGWTRYSPGARQDTDAPVELPSFLVN